MKKKKKKKIMIRKPKTRLTRSHGNKIQNKRELKKSRRKSEYARGRSGNEKEKRLRVITP